jgi:hypothetical protein
MSSLLGGSGSGSSSIPSPPPFNPIDIKSLANRALDKDVSKYFSYTFPVFPGMTDVRNAEISDAYKQLTGPLSPEFQNEFLKNATVSERGVTGGGDPFSGMGMTKGSFNQGGASASVARQTMAKQDYDRARFEGLMSANPIPGLGLSQNDLLSLYTYNTGAQNAFNMANYGNQIAGANAAYATNINNINSIGSLVSGLGNIYSQYQLYNGGSGFSPAQYDPVNYAG